jgi:hypothetical protein
MCVGHDGLVCIIDKVGVMIYGSVDSGQWTVDGVHKNGERKETAIGSPPQWKQQRDMNASA